MAESFYCSYDLPLVTVRPFNTFGPRQSARAVIPTIITQALTGNMIRLGNLDTTRDFTYVNDTLRGFLLAGSAVGIEGGVFNLGTGVDFRIDDIAQRIALKVGHKVEIIVEPQRLRPEKSEVLRLISDNRLARTKLGWEPLVSLDDGLDQTINWIQSHMNLYQPGQYVV